MTTTIPEQACFAAQKGALAPLSFVQQEIWLRSQLALSDPICNEEVVALQRKGSLNPHALELAFSEITRRHAILRTVFGSADGTPIQAIKEHLTAKLPITDLSDLPHSRRNFEVLRIAREETLQRFDLATGPLMRARLIRVSRENHVLVVTLHTMIADEWSLNVLAYELVTLYQAYSVGDPSPLPDLPVQYLDYADSQRSWVKDEAIEQQTACWIERLAGIPRVLELPVDRPRLPVQRFSRARQFLMLPKSLSESLHELSEREGVAPFVTLLAAFKTLLSRYAGQADIVVGSIVHGRDPVETDSLIGHFARTVVMRTDLGGDPTFRESVWRVRDGTRWACEHQNVSLERLVKELQPERDPSHNPLFQVLFSMAPSFSLPQEGWGIANLEVNTNAAKVDLQLQLKDSPEGIAACFTFDTDLFDAVTIARMAGHFQTLLQGVVANPDQSLSRLPLLSNAERHQLLVEWNNTQTDYPRSLCVHQLFEGQVDRTPDATALVFKNENLIYLELNRRANQLAHHLIKVGVGPDVLVGICVERSLDMVVGLLGILKAGGAYVPLDPAYPRERLTFMLEDAEVPVLLTQQRLLKNLPQSSARVVCLDTGWHEIAKESAENPGSTVEPGNLAYVIYTSGSTGKPKGVQIPHRAVVNFLTSMSQRPGMGSGDRLLAVTTLSFDIAGLEIYLPLILGASLEIVSRELLSDGSQLLLKLASSDATVMQATPATWRMLIEAGWQGSKDLKLLCGGEAMPREMVSELLNRASSVWNMYGPTETTIWSSTSQITSADNPITVGSPIANTEFYVLDRHLQPVPLGVSGELYIGGEGVARGYLHRPQLTAEKFIPNPFREPESTSRLYKTGDLARYRANGEIECLGRIDNQVKVRGFRIELGEIETALGGCAGVLQNAVVVREDNTAEKQLVAYVVPVAGQPPSIPELRDLLKQKLPDYMLPSRFVFLEALPLTPNGKVDRRALPVPEQLELTPQKGYVPPRDSIESRLVEIWESVLDIHTVGIKENFFELGGHSLIVAKLLRRIEDAFEKKLSMAVIFEAPTVEQQASVLRNGSALKWPSALVPIQPAGFRPPFFCFGSGAGPIFRPLARRLGSEQPLIGVDPTLLKESQIPESYRMEDIAACLAKQMRELQPEGPYYLGGICGGGLMAYATASYLLAQGQQVATLALFEPHPSYYDYYVEHSIGFRLGWLSRRVKFHFENLQRLETKDARVYMRDHIRERSKVFFTTLNRLLQKTVSDLRPSMHNGRLENIRDILGRAYRAYRPQPFPGQVALFQATYREPGGDWERQYWTELATKIAIHEVPGYSNWIVRFFLEPNVEILASRLQAYLPGVQNAGG